MVDSGREIVSWQDLDTLVEGLAGRVGRDYDLILAISRGGLVPAGMLAYRLGIREILVAAVSYYDDSGRRAGEPVVLHFPPDERLRERRVLIVDEVWESGATITAVADRVVAAGATPTTAVLHYKPSLSIVDRVPDHFVVTTEAWVVYPFKAGR